MDLAAYQFVVSNAGNWNFSGVWIFFSISYILSGKNNKIVAIQIQDTCMKGRRYTF
jgi:glycopeptide antibiotics resistance protein